MAHPKIPFTSDMGPGDLRSYSIPQLQHAKDDPWLAGSPREAILNELRNRAVSGTPGGFARPPQLTAPSDRVRRKQLDVPGPAKRKGIPRAKAAIPGRRDMIDDFEEEGGEADVFFAGPSTRGLRATEQGFIHKRIAGAVGGFVTGGPGGAIGGFLSGGGQAGSSVPQNLPGPPLGVAQFGITGGDPCGFGSKWDARSGRCTMIPFLGTARGRDAALARPGPSGMGGWQPSERPISRADCGRGAVLGRDGMCYDKRTIRNSDRMWPKGRKPLLTGGDLRCIATASRAANRLKTTTKRLQKLGMMPKIRRASSK